MESLNAKNAVYIASRRGSLLIAMHNFMNALIGVSCFALFFVKKANDSASEFNFVERKEKSLLFRPIFCLLAVFHEKCRNDSPQQISNKNSAHSSTNA